MLSVEEIKAKHGHAIPMMIHNLLETGKCMDEIEARLIREGKLEIINGKYHRLDKSNK